MKERKIAGLKMRLPFTSACNIYVCIFLQICIKFEHLIFRSNAATFLRFGRKYYIILFEI